MYIWKEGSPKINDETFHLKKWDEGDKTEHRGSRWKKIIQNRNQWNGTQIIEKLNKAKKMALWKYQ